MQLCGECKKVVTCGFHQPDLVAVLAGLAHFHLVNELALVNRIEGKAVAVAFVDEVVTATLCRNPLPELAFFVPGITHSQKTVRRLVMRQCFRIAEPIVRDLIIVALDVCDRPELAIVFG